jgi:hypothetical protein
MSEKPYDESDSPVIGAVSGRLKGRLMAKSYTVVFTEEQTVFARMTSALRKQDVLEERAAAKDGGAGRLGQWKAQMGAHATFHERYHSMSVEEIIAEHGKNHAIDNRSVRSVRLTQPTTIYDDEGGYDQRNPLLVIETPGKKYKIRLDDNMDYGRVKDLLEQVYGARLQ